MAPIKYEEQMKEKLEKRSLQPSPESWANLSNRLDREQKNKNKSMFWWFGIAASIVGAALVTILFFNNKPLENGTNIIVDTQNQNDSLEDVLQINQMNFPKPKEVVEAENVNQIEKRSNTSMSKEIKKDVVSEKYTNQKSKIQQDVVVVDNEKTQNQIEKVNEISSSASTLENQKVQELVAQIKGLQQNGQTVTESEIDSLLKKAQKEILSNQLYNETIRTVDANALLQDVEEDLQQSFRSKVFEALQSGYESVKTTVVQRNN